MEQYRQQTSMQELLTNYLILAKIEEHEHISRLDVPPAAIDAVGSHITTSEMSNVPMATIITGIVIPYDVDLPVTTIEFERGDIHTMHDIVGGHFEVVDSITYQSSVWINDEGKLLRLPVNARATLLLWLDEVWRRRDVIAGNALITGPADDDGNTTSVPSSLVNLLLETTRFKAQVQTAGSDTWSGNQLEFGDAFAAMQYVLNLEQRWKLVTNVRVVTG